MTPGMIERNAAPLRLGVSHDQFLGQARRALRGLSFQLRGHGMGRAALAAGCVIFVKDTTLRCFVESGSKYAQLGFDFALISSGNRRTQLFLLRFDSSEY